MHPAPCRFCSAPLSRPFADLGMSPLANSYVAAERFNAMEPFYPLRALVCDACLLVQLEEYESAEAIFGEYAYFSSYSTTWLEHSERYARDITERLSLTASSLVVELASNDGYLLQYFQERGIPVLGVEPAANVARTAIRKRIPTLVEFFGVEMAQGLASDTRADLLIGNNVLAHVPDLNDFVGGMKLLLADDGVITMEFPHLLRLMADRQFDTIYHEHFSYFSFLTAQRVFAAHGLRLFDVEQLPTHGGSLRIYGCHDEDPRADTPAVAALLEEEHEAGLQHAATYDAFEAAVRADKRHILTTLLALKDEGCSIAAYGAPAKGNTLLNYCGIGTDVIDFTVDRNPHKQGHFLPGSRIPIRAAEAIDEARPDVVLLLPWNLREELMEQLAHIRGWGGRFAVRNPELVVL